MRIPRPTYANVTASLALFIALGGTSYAVTQLPKNSVGSTQLKTGAVTNAKLAKGAVSADKLASGTVVTGPAGPRGPRGAEGATGAAGASAVNSDVVIARRPNEAQLGLEGGQPVTLATVPLTAGSWNLDASLVLAYLGTENQQEWFGCKLSKPGTTLATGGQRVGATAGAASQTTVALATATSVTGPTTVTLSCEHASTITGTRPTVSSTILRATRVASIDER